VVQHSDSDRDDGEQALPATPPEAWTVAGIRFDTTGWPGGTLELSCADHEPPAVRARRHATLY
jgi:hypothetical protein